MGTRPLTVLTQAVFAGAAQDEEAVDLVSQLEFDQLGQGFGIHGAAVFLQGGDESGHDAVVLAASLHREKSSLK